MKKKNMFDNTNLQQDIVWGNIQLPGMSDEQLHNTNWNRVDDIINKKSLAYREHNRNIMKKKYENDMYREDIVNKINSVRQTEAYQENHKKGIEKRNNSSSYWQNYYKGIENRNTEEYRQSLSKGVRRRIEEDPEYIERKRQSQIKKSLERRGYIVCPAGIFETQTQALEALGINYHYLKKYMKENPKQYYYLRQEKESQNE